MSKISIKGVLIGGVVDVASSLLLGIPVIFVALAKVDFAHTPKDQLGPAIAAAANGSTLIFVLQMVVGLGCSTLGGYVAARIAKHHDLLNGLLSSYLCTALAIYSLAAGKDHLSSATHVLMFLSSPAFALLGGYLSLLKGQKPSPLPPTAQTA